MDQFSNNLMNQTPFKTFLEASRDHQFQIEKRKFYLSKLFNQIVLFQNRIIAINEQFYNIEETETLFVEVMPVLQNIRHNINHIDKWATAVEIENNKKLGHKSFSVFHSRGIINISINEQLPFYFTLTTIISAISAGNKCVVNLIDFPEEIKTLILRIVQNAIPEDIILILNQKEETIQFNQFVDSDFYFGSGNFYLNKLLGLEEKKNNNFNNIENFKSFGIIDEGFSKLEHLQSVLYNSVLYNGNLYSNNKVFFVHKEQLSVIKKNIEELYSGIIRRDKKKDHLIKKEYTVDNDNTFHRIKIFLTSINKNSGEYVLMGGGFNDEKRSVETTIIETNLYSKTWKEFSNGPIIFIVPYFNVLDIVKSLEFFSNINKLYIYSKNKKNIQIFYSYINSEQYLVNEIFMDRYNFSNLQPENDTFFRGYGGFANFSLQKTIHIKTNQSIFESILIKKITPIIKKWFEINFYKKFSITSFKINKDEI